MFAKDIKPGFRFQSVGGDWYTVTEIKHFDDELDLIEFWCIGDQGQDSKFALSPNFEFKDTVN